MLINYVIIKLFSENRITAMTQYHNKFIYIYEHNVTTI